MLAERILAPSPERPSIFLVVSVVLLIACRRSAAAAEAWLVREQSGTLQYRLPESSEWSPAAPGSELQPGTTVRAGSGRPVILTQAASSIVIRAGSELTLPPTGTATVVQWLGSVRYEVEPGSLPGFFVDTRYLVTGIKGTIFEVLASEAGTEVRVSEGLVEVARPDGRFRAEMASGQTARIGSARGSSLEVRSDSDVASPLTPAEVEGVRSPRTAAAHSLWSGIGRLLSDVDIVHDDRLTTRRRGTLVRTLSGGLATVGGRRARGGAGDGAGGGNSGGSSSSRAGGGGGGGSSGAGAGSKNASGSAGGGRGGGGVGSGGVGSAVGSVGGAVGGAVGGLSNAVGGALGKR